MRFITADILFDDDIRLTFGGTSLSLTASAVESTLSDGSDVYFLGIINTDSRFASANVTTAGGGSFLYNVDDITLARIPEPTGCWASVQSRLAVPGDAPKKVIH